MRFQSEFVFCHFTLKRRARYLGAPPAAFLNQPKTPLDDYSIAAVAVIALATLTDSS